MESVRTIKGFVEWLTDVVLRKPFYPFGKTEKYGPWFRGQENADWALLPKSYRDGYFRPDIAERETMEDETREEFMVRAPALSDSTPGDPWDRYFRMQHFGAPTRLLDWSEGALVALYFAVRPNPNAAKTRIGTTDARVWALDPYELNRKAIQRAEVFPVGPFAKDKDNSDVAPWLEIAQAKASPVAVFPIHTMRRISSQRSCFTVFGAEQEGLSGHSDCLKSVRIPGSSVHQIRRHLEICGFDETTIYPDLEGLGRTVSARWVK